VCFAAPILDARRLVLWEQPEKQVSFQRPAGEEKDEKNWIDWF